MNILITSNILAKYYSTGYTSFYYIEALGHVVRDNVCEGIQKAWLRREEAGIGSSGNRSYRQYHGRSEMRTALQRSPESWHKASHLQPHIRHQWTMATSGGGITKSSWTAQLPSDKAFQGHRIAGRHHATLVVSNEMKMSRDSASTTNSILT